MSIPVLTFFNNKGGVGKTSLVYHLSSMFSELNVRVLAVDLDPQANLTAAFLDEEVLAEIWEDSNSVYSIFRSVEPLHRIGDFAPVEYKKINSHLALIPGDLRLSGFEDQLSSAWVQAMGDDKYRPFLILTAFWRSAQASAKQFDANLIVMDVGPNLGAINRAALLGSNHVVVPLGADLFSLQGLRNLGPTLRNWRKDWNNRRDSWKQPEFNLPVGDMFPVGYIAMRHGVRLTRPVKAYTRWLAQIPYEFRTNVLDEVDADKAMLLEEDPYCLAMLKNYNSLMPLGLEARKPIFFLKTADGAIGSHSYAVQSAYDDFKKLAREIAEKINLPLPE